jgi:UPF0755 protein
MSNNDEFESLIKSFKLDDVDAQQPAAPQGKRRAFDFDAPEPQKRRAPVGAPPAARVTAQAAAKGPDRPKRRSFQVNIDDSEFLSRPHCSANRLSWGQRRRHGDDGDEDDTHGPGSFSRWMRALIALAVVLGVSVFLAFFALASAQDLFGLNKKDMEIEFTLPPDQSITQIAALLKEKGIIDQPFTFRVYAGLKNDAGDFLPGDYALNSNMSYEQIMVKFRTPNRESRRSHADVPRGRHTDGNCRQARGKRVCKADDLYAYLDAGGVPVGI